MPHSFHIHVRSPFCSQYHRHAGAEGDADGAGQRHHSRAAHCAGGGRGIKTRPRQHHIILASVSPDRFQHIPGADEPNGLDEQDDDGLSEALQTLGLTNVQLINAHMQKTDEQGWNVETGITHFPESGHFTLLIYSSFNIWQAERNSGRICCSVGNTQI